MTSAFVEPATTIGADPAKRPRQPGAPRVEAAIRAIFSEVLGVPAVRAHDDFFALGGHSLLATRALASAYAAFGVELPVRALFEAPTPAALARRFEEALRGGL